MNKDFRRSALSLSNDIIFCEVMRNKEICTLFLEKLLNKRITKIVYINKQQDLSADITERGVRLDVYIEDNKGNRYDIEMQRYIAPDFGLRVRYIQHEIDHRILEKGDDYSNMSNSYVIFICDFDPFGCRRAQYTFQTRETSAPKLVLKDGRTVIFLNAHYETGDADGEILEFLDRVRDGGYEAKGGTLSQMAVKAAEKLRRDERTVKSVMTLATRIKDAERYGLEIGYERGIEKGIEQGIERGIEKGTSAMISLLRDMGFDDAAICEKLVQKFDFTQEDAIAAIEHCKDA